MSANQQLVTKMSGALQLADSATITSASGVLTLTSDTNCFIAEGTEAITSIVGGTDVTQGVYVITWSTARTLTYNSSTLKLLGQADRTTAVGDVGVYQLNDGVVTELIYSPVSGKAASAAAADTATTAESCSGNAATATLATEATVADSVAWDNVTGKPSTFTPPVATASTLGGIKEGTGLSIASDGTASVNVSAIIPPGAVQYFAMATAPTGWLIADGSAVSRTVYASLYAAIGTTFGTGDGSTTFNLPDLRGEFLRGFDDGRGIDSGREFGSSQHATAIRWGLGSTTTSPAALVVCPSQVSGYGEDELISETIAAPDSIYGTTTSQACSSWTTRPRNIALLACIKY